MANETEIKYLRHIKLSDGNGIRNLMDHAVPGGEKNPLFEEAFATFREVYAKVQTDTTGPYDGILDAVRELQEHGIKMAIVSNYVADCLK